ncbi:MAG: MBL fold metallo-hydrolase [Desulfobulbus sp.]|nr:MBL fold metallo-hydrolase [Desulfobulbus sp.]
MSVPVNIKNTRVVILVDNTGVDGFATEHGFALWVEADGMSILFDTGQGGALSANAGRAGIRLSSAEHVVLSHGHYDHTGGLDTVIHQAHNCTLHCHPGAVFPRYAIRNHDVRSIQMPRRAMTVLDRFPQERVHWVQQPALLKNGVGLTGPIDRKTVFEESSGPFFLDQSGYRPDPFDDDLALWIRTEQGLIVCVGCAHAGLINTLLQAQRQNNGMRIRAVIGGFHLISADPDKIEMTLQALRKLEPDLIIPCHCTGEVALASLCRAFGDRCRPGAAGLEVQFAGAAP